jgi:hypothetical protein
MANHGNTCSLTPVWSLLTAGTELVSVSGRQPEERIHSAGRVLADRSVLFKYINPNLAVFLAQAGGSARTFWTFYFLFRFGSGNFSDRSEKQNLNCRSRIAYFDVVNIQMLYFCKFQVYFIIFTIFWLEY